MYRTAEELQVHMQGTLDRLAQFLCNAMHGECDVTLRQADSDRSYTRK